MRESVGSTEPAIALFNRDLRVHDHPPLAAACREREQVVPLFVIDDVLISTRVVAPKRAPILIDALLDIRHALRRRGGDLIVRRGEPAREALAAARAAGARSIYAADDISMFARPREKQLVE
ncbi:MAG: deoxyribodipyrimidine photo-lyase, partial [Gaiellaceae bacterium]